MLNTTKLLENKLFQERYIKPNIDWYFSYLNGKRGMSRIYKTPYAILMKKFFLQKYFEKRIKKRIIDIPYLELVLTTKCTMRCQSCNNLMQYFSQNNQYTCTFEGIKNHLKFYFPKWIVLQELEL
ncbi:hypothetical protein OLS39_08805 [Campylobacter jejuni]|nr:hypothetical protein [Campylobacter jejuni]